MEDPIVSDVIIENRAGVGSVFHDDSMFGTGKKDDPLGVNREQFLPQNDQLNFRDAGWGLQTLNLVAYPWAGGDNRTGLAGMTMLSVLGTCTGQFLSTSLNPDYEVGKYYNTFDVCAMNSSGYASGFVCRLYEGETEGTVELFAPKELPVDDDNNFVASTHWVQKVVMNYLPLSGGQLNGVLGFDVGVGGVGEALPFITLRGVYNDNEVQTIISYSPYANSLSFGGSAIVDVRDIMPTGLAQLGGYRSPWKIAYIEKISVGGDGSENIIVPKRGGTMATVEDINEVVGDISAILDYINGEAI